MKYIYQTSLKLSAPDSFSHVVDDILAWLYEDRQGIPKIPAGLYINDEERIEWNGPGVEIEIIQYSDKDIKQFGVCFLHDQFRNESNEVESVICICENKNEVYFSATVGVRAKGLHLRPVDLPPNRPRIVRDIVSKYGADGLITKAEPIYATVENFSQIKKLIVAQDRSLPIIYASARHLDDRVILNLSKIADRCAGLALVIGASSRFVSFGMRDDWNRDATCYNGSVKIYWPKFNPSDNPFNHPLFTPERIEGIEKTFKGGLADYLLDYFSHISIGRPIPYGASWESIDSNIQKRILEKARGSNNAEYLTLLEAENRRLEDLARQNVNRMESLTAERDSALRQIECWRSAYEEERSKKPERDVPLPPTSVREVKERIELEYKGRILFSLNSKSEWEDNPFTEPELLYQAFKELGTKFLSCRLGEDRCDDFDIYLREKCKFEYGAHQSEMTMTQYPDYYKMRYSGKDYFMKEHIGKGNVKDARYTIRIGFVFIDALKIFVIGYIGQHQKTSST